MWPPANSALDCCFAAMYNMDTFYGYLIAVKSEVQTGYWWITMKQTGKLLKLRSITNMYT